MRLAWGFRPPPIHNLPTNLSETPKESLWIHAHLPLVVETNRAVHLGALGQSHLSGPIRFMGYGILWS